MDNAHLDAALQQEADADRATLRGEHGFTIGGQSTQEIAQNGTNEQVILAQRSADNFLIGQAMNPCPQAGMHCGIMVPFGEAGDAAPGGAANPIQELPRVGSALKGDAYHAFPDIVDNYASEATRTTLPSGATLYQVEGSLNGVPGRFEWIVDHGSVTHRLFVAGGTLNGAPTKP